MLVSPNPDWNPTGFFEDQDLSRQINCGVLYALNYAWDSLSIIDANIQTATHLSHLKEKAITLLQSRMQHWPYFGFKDPRTAKILTFWQDVFHEMQMDTQYIICLRNPLASAYSYQKLRSFDLVTGLSLWLMHLIPAVEDTQRQKRMMISFENMLADPISQLARMQIQLKMSGANPHELLRFQNDFLNKKHPHYHYSLAELKNHPAASVVPLSIQTYELLLAAANDQIDMQSASFAEEWQKIKQEFQRLSPLFSYLDGLLKKNKQYEKTARALNKSWLLKFIYPLRWIENTIRIQLRHRREKRKLKKSYA